MKYSPDRAKCVQSVNNDTNRVPPTEPNFRAKYYGHTHGCFGYEWKGVRRMKCGRRNGTGVNNREESGRGWKKRKFFIFMCGGKTAKIFAVRRPAVRPVWRVLLLWSRRICHRTESVTVNMTKVHTRPHRTELINLFSHARGSATDTL